MPLNGPQKERVTNHLASKKILHVCPVCNATNKWAHKDLVFIPLMVNGIPQHTGITSVLVECDNCGFQLLLSAEKLKLA